VNLLLYVALGVLAVVVIFGLSTDVRAAARRLFPPRRQRPAPSSRLAVWTLRGRMKRASPLAGHSHDCLPADRR